MNRAQRRRQQREAEKNPTYMMTEKQLHDAKLEAAKTAIDTSYILLLAMPIMVMRDELNYSKTMRAKVLDQIITRYNNFMDNQYDMRKIIELVEEETKECKSIYREHLGGNKNESVR